jgi:hypothetical protein
LINSQNVTGTLKFNNCVFINGDITADLTINVTGWQSINMAIVGNSQKPASVSSLSNMLSTLESQNPAFYNSRFGGKGQIQLISPYSADFSGSPHGEYGKVYKRLTNGDPVDVKYTGGSGVVKASLVDSTSGSFKGDFVLFQDQIAKLRNILKATTTVGIANKVASKLTSATSISGECKFIIGDLVTSDGLSGYPTVCTTSCSSSPTTSIAACTSLSPQESITLTSNSRIINTDEIFYLTATVPIAVNNAKQIRFTSSNQEISSNPSNCTIQVNKTSCTTSAFATNSGIITYTASAGNYNNGSVNVRFINNSPTPEPTPDPEPT